MAYLQKMPIEMMQNSTKRQPRSFICVVCGKVILQFIVPSIETRIAIAYSRRLTMTRMVKLEGNQAQVTDYSDEK